ncbi:MAG: hypothetical protein NUV73_01895 [Candidatus Daviesbacteria bacterium]|nr:hypothetical protein [Candidatus Daviesbacteria bacterium]
MIARLLISPAIERRTKEIKNILDSHITPELIAQEGVNVKHPDILYFQAGEKLGIAEARKIKKHFSLKPYSAKGRAVILADASALTTEAQNALLKTLEELPEEALLILATNSDANLLPTVLSRCQIIRLENPTIPLTPASNISKAGKKAGSDQEDIERLLSADMEERFGYIEKLKNKEEFLKALLLYFHQDVEKNKDFLIKLLQAEEWAKQNVNIRAILEYLMLVMPKCEDKNN